MFTFPKAKKHYTHLFQDCSKIKPSHDTLTINKKDWDLALNSMKRHFKETMLANLKEKNFSEEEALAKIENELKNFEDEHKQEIMNCYQRIVPINKIKRLITSHYSEDSYLGFFAKINKEPKSAEELTKISIEIEKFFFSTPANDRQEKEKSASSIKYSEENFNAFLSSLLKIKLAKTSLSSPRASLKRARSNSETLPNAPAAKRTCSQSCVFSKRTLSDVDTEGLNEPIAKRTRNQYKGPFIRLA